MAAETRRHGRSGAHFAKVLWAHNLNLVKNTGSIHVKNDEPNMVLYYTCHMPGVLDLIGSSESKLEQKEFSRGFNYELSNFQWNGSHWLVVFVEALDKNE